MPRINLNDCFAASRSLLNPKIAKSLMGCFNEALAFSNIFSNSRKLFKSNCASCHFGPALSSLSYQKMGVKQDYFENRGTPLTEVDNGRFNVTRQENDRHYFKVPVLRNVELTFSYFHDGSVKTLTGKYKGKPLLQLTAENLK